MKNATSLELYHYWNNLRGSRTAPLRNHVDPMAIRSILPDLFTLKNESSDSDPIFSLTGTRLYNLFQRELRGTAFASLWERDAAAFATKIVFGVQEHGLPVVFDIAGGYADDLPDISLEMLLLPLDEDDGGRRRIIGCLGSEPAISDFSRPLDHLRLMRSRLLEVTPQVYPGASNDVAIDLFSRSRG